MKRITHGALYVTKMHSATGDVDALCCDLRYGICHYFGDHRQCSSIFSKQSTTGEMGNAQEALSLLLSSLRTDPLTVAKLPPRLVFPI